MFAHDVKICRMLFLNITSSSRAVSGMNGFDFGSANDAQRNAITSTEGPLLVTAGPGTGKTFTLVKRVSYLVQEKHVDPSSILVATFTEKAAKELVTRISNELAASGVEFDVNEMYVGTFHSICLRLIKEHIEYSNVRKNYRVADSFDQQYLVYQNYWSRFKSLEHFAELPKKTRVWDRPLTSRNKLKRNENGPQGKKQD